MSSRYVSSHTYGSYDSQFPVQKSNYAETSTAIAGLEEDEDSPGGRSVKGKARQVVISDKRGWPGIPKKKSTHNVRTAVLYKKNLDKLIEESVSTGSAKSLRWWNSHRRRASRRCRRMCPPISELRLPHLKNRRA